jgi:hypothetical protein
VIPPRDVRPLSDGLAAVMGSLKGGDVRTVKGIFGTWDEAVAEIRARLEAVGGTVVDRIEVRVAGARQRTRNRR